MSMNILNDISAVYLQQIAEKKDDSYLETDMEKRHENNEKAREDMKKTKAYKDMAKSARKSMGIDDEDEEDDDIKEATYSAKAARAGKDIGKPGKAFAKIAKSAAERYGSEERGKKVAGAVLAKLRKEALDPVGQEDSDIDNDGDTDKSDKYLHKRRKAIGNAISKKKSVKEALDPVGQEDDDIDNDGDTDSSDKYLHKRRKAIGKAIGNKSVKESNYYDPMDDDEFDHDEAEENRGVSGKNNPKGGKSLIKKKKSVKEGFSNWRQDLSEVMDDIEANKEIKEKKVNNKIKINPEIKEAVEQLGGELIEMVELDEGMTMKDFKKQRSRQKQKEKRASDKIAPNRREGIHADKASPERAARHRANVDPDFEGDDERNYPGGKLNPKKVRKAKALGELGEENQLDEIAPLAAGALAAGAAAAPYLIKKFAKPSVDKTLDTETKRIQKNRGLTQTNSYEPEGEVVEQIRSYPSTTPIRTAPAPIKTAPKPIQSGPKIKTSPASIKTAPKPIQSGPKIKQMNSYELEGNQINEKTLTSAETKEKERIVKSMKKSAGDFEKRYPGRGKEVMYATATKMAKKVAEDVEQIDERRREDKGTPRPQRDRALEVVKGMIRQQTGTPAGQRKKVPGKKPPTAGQYGAPKSPAQKLKLRKAQQQRSQDWQQDTKGT